MKTEAGLIPVPELDDFTGIKWFEVVTILSERGYCSHVARIDAQVIWESDEICAKCCCPELVTRLFPVGMQRNDESYRAFAVCSHCYRVVFEL